MIGVDEKMRKVERRRKVMESGEVRKERGKEEANKSKQDSYSDSEPRHSGQVAINLNRRRLPKQLQESALGRTFGPLTLIFGGG